MTRICTSPQLKFTFQRASAVLIALVVFTIFAGRLWAHHSVAGYEKEKTVLLRGVVLQYIWRNPHVVVVWNVKGGDGKVVQWSGEMNSPTSMISVGMNRNSLKPGDEIIVTAYASRSGNPLAVIQKITFADGKPVVDRVGPIQ